MFSSSDVTCSSFESSWQKELHTSGGSSQTDPLQAIDGSSQLPERVSVATQWSSSRGKHGHDEKVDESRIDFQSLSTFLNQVAVPITVAEIQKSMRSFRLLSHMQSLWDQDDKKAQLLHKFTSDHVLALQEGDKVKARHKYVVSCATWNSSASMVLVAYRVAGPHEEWCSHESFLFLWNLYRDHERSSKPSLVLDIEFGCVTTLEAHPRAASVFALGTASGKVLVINSRFTGSEAGGENYVRATNQAVAHQDAVSLVHWIQGERARGDQLVSMGLDGRIYLWRMNTENRGALELVNAYVIYVQDLPRSLGIKGSSATSGGGSESQVGITCASFSWEDSASTFLAGCHGGAIFQCSLVSTTPAAQQSTAELGGFEQNFISPLVVSFTPHRGHVNSIQFSSTLRNTFLSSAADGELRVYSLLNPKPLMLIHCPSGVRQAAWSMVREACIYALQEDGLLAIYNVKSKSSASKAPLIVPFEERTQAPISSFALNIAERKDQLAVCTKDKDGSVCLWDLSRVFPASFDKRISSAEHSKQGDAPDN